MALAELLITKGADVNAKWNGGLTYLHQEDGNQMVIHGQTASKMTGHPAVILGLLTIQGTNLGTLGRHCQHRSSLNVVIRFRCF